MLIVQGQQQAGLVAAYMAQAFGTAWFTNGWFQLKFVATLQVFDPVELCGLVTGIKLLPAGDIEVHIDVWVRRMSDARLTTVGWASCVLAASD